MKSFLFLSAAIAVSTWAERAFALQLVFNTRADLRITWTSMKRTEPFVANDLYRFENIVSSLLTQLFKDEELTGLLPHQIVLATNVFVTDQTVQTTSNLSPDTKTDFSITSTLDFMYAGEEPLYELAATMSSVIASNTGVGLFQLLSEGNLVEQEVTNFSISFVKPQGATETLNLYVMPSIESRAAAKGLIAFVVLLTLALLMVSSVLLWVSGGCLWVKSAMPWYMLNGVPTPYGSKPDDEGDNATVVTGASGVLGAASNDDEENNSKPITSFTPSRGLYRDDMFSPFSNVTNTTEHTNTINNYPLGIISMRKLARFESPNNKTGRFLPMSRMSPPTGGEQDE